jgi:bacteriorhodopsin
MFELLYNTVFISLFVQIITGIAGVHGLIIPLQKEDMILREVLLLEVIVQMIEFIFYLWFAYGVISIKQNKSSNFELMNVTKRRYIDWFITTPTMLVSTIIFLEYLKFKKMKKDDETKDLEFVSFVKEHKELIFFVFLSNAMMLLFGYFVEIGYLSKLTGISLGFIFLILTFSLMYKKFAKDTLWGRRLFIFMFSVWSLYGISAIFSFYIKNIGYNILDILAKNFFGLFLYFIILQQQKNSNSHSV